MIYPLKDSEAGKIFTTSNGSVYQLILYSSDLYFPGHPKWNRTFYQVILDKIEGEPTRDSNIMITVGHYLFEQLDDANTALCWVHSTEERKHHARYRYFKRWVSQLLRKPPQSFMNFPVDDIKVIDAIIKDDELGEQYIMIVLRKSHPHYTTIIIALEEFLKDITK